MKGLNMSKEAKKPVVEAPQIISDEEIATIKQSVKDWSEGKESITTAVKNIAAMLSPKTTYQQYAEMQSQWSAAYLAEHPDDDEKDIRSERSKLFGAALKKAKIEKPKAKTDASENRAENRTQRAERIQKLEDLGTAELATRLQAAKNTIANATTKKAGTTAAAQMTEILEAQENLRKKSEAKHEEAKKELRAEARELLKEASFAKLKKAIEVLKG
jgi:hypothetical protein